MNVLWCESQTARQNVEEKILYYIFWSRLKGVIGFFEENLFLWFCCSIIMFSEYKTQ